jgi:hypothetical protein
VHKRDKDVSPSVVYHQVTMTRRVTARLVPRMLFGLALAVSVGLLVLIVLAPLLRGAAFIETSRLLDVFAHDATLRRTAIAVAIGLLATACIFFRHPFGTPHHRLPRVPPPRRDHGF